MADPWPVVTCSTNVVVVGMWTLERVRRCFLGHVETGGRLNDLDRARGRDDHVDPSIVWLRGNVVEKVLIKDQGDDGH